MTDQEDLPEGGDLSGGDLSPQSLAIGADQLKWHADELQQSIRHREWFFWSTLGISALLLSALLVFIFCGHSDAVTTTVLQAGKDAQASTHRPVVISRPSHVRLVELIVLALLPSALLLKLGSMVSHRHDSEKKPKELDVPLASVTVAQEAIKSIAELAKTFKS